MGQLVSMLVGVVVVIAATIGIFVGANVLLDQAPKRFTLFTTLLGALIGAVLGVVANSGGWFLGGPLWPLGGAALGALVGRFVWGAHPPPADRRWRIAEKLRPVVFLAPALAFLTVALVAPMIRTVWLSFRNKSGEESVGTRNYRDIVSDDRVFNLNGFGTIVGSRLFVLGVLVLLAGLVAVVLGAFRVERGGRVIRRGVDLAAPTPVLTMTGAAILVLLAAVSALRGVIWNNLFWVVFVTGLSTIIGLAIAVLADRAKGESLAKSLIFMPMAISFVGASVIWRFVYAYSPGKTQFGLLNAVWVQAGGDPQSWLLKGPWNTMFLIAIMIWIQTGFAMVVLSSAIKGVPEDLLEASRVDGASEAQTFWWVTVPHIRATIAVVVTTLVITVLKIYDIVKVMTNGEFGTNVIANEMFQVAFINRDRGLGAALAVLLLIPVLPIMLINVRRVRRGEA